MPAPLSLDLRRRILAASLDEELSAASLARRFKVAPATAWRIISRYKTVGEVEPLPHGGGREASIPPTKEHRIETLLSKKPDATTEELAFAYNKRWKAAVTRSSMGRTLARMGLTSKKKRSAQQSKIGKMWSKSGVTLSDSKSV